MATAAVVASAAVVAACSDRDAGSAATTTTGTRAPSCRAGRGRDVTLRRDRQVVLVHLPACYDRVTTRYPTVYLVHGSGADERQWVDIGMTSEADRLTRIADIAPVILVMPREGETPSSGEARDLVELVPWADAHLRTVPDAAHRAAAGISRGGEAALKVAAAHPELFGVVAAHSPTFPADTAALAAGLPPLSGRIWLDAGESDPLHLAVTRFARALDRDGTRADTQITPGGHDRDYWSAHTDDYLTFYAARWR